MAASPPPSDDDEFDFSSSEALRRDVHRGVGNDPHRRPGPQDRSEAPAAMAAGSKRSRDGTSLPARSDQVQSDEASHVGRSTSTGDVAGGAAHTSSTHQSASVSDSSALPPATAAARAVSVPSRTELVRTLVQAAFDCNIALGEEHAQAVIEKSQDMLSPHQPQLMTTLLNQCGVSGPDMMPASEKILARFTSLIVEKDTWFYKLFDKTGWCVRCPVPQFRPDPKELKAWSSTTSLRRAVDDAIASFQVVVMDGASGSGKSAALRLLTSKPDANALDVYGLWMLGSRHLSATGQAAAGKSHTEREIQELEAVLQPLEKSERDKKVVEYVTKLLDGYLGVARAPAGCRVALAFDECGACPHFVRGLISAKDAIRGLRCLAAAAVSIVVVGTGVATTTPGSLPAHYRTVYMGDLTDDYYEALKLTGRVKRLTHPLTKAMAKNGRALALIEQCANTDASESELGLGLAVRVAHKYADYNGIGKLKTSDGHLRVLGEMWRVLLLSKPFREYDSALDRVDTATEGVADLDLESVERLARMSGAIVDNRRCFDPSTGGIGAGNWRYKLENGATYRFTMPVANFAMLLVGYGSIPTNSSDRFEFAIASCLFGAALAAQSKAQRPGQRSGPANLHEVLALLNASNIPETLRSFALPPLTTCSWQLLQLTSPLCPAVPSDPPRDSDEASRPAASGEKSEEAVSGDRNRAKKAAVVWRVPTALLKYFPSLERQYLERKQERGKEASAVQSLTVWMNPLGNSAHFADVGLYVRSGPDAFGINCQAKFYDAEVRVATRKWNAILFAMGHPLAEDTHAGPMLANAMVNGTPIAGLWPPKVLMQKFAAGFAMQSISSAPGQRSEAIQDCFILTTDTFPEPLKHLLGALLPPDASPSPSLEFTAVDTPDGKTPARREH